ncbi:MFS transporter [Lacisediminihabitans sp.]|uniref:MFS transporter n=1 Tax=Lacisediminihabitans sp. TaxID=2787631 RepID=UPI00374D3440
MSNSPRITTLPQYSRAATGGHRFTLAPGMAFAGTAVGFASLYLAAGAPTPLLALYQREWHFAPSALTIAFAAYAIGLIAALLVTGSLSDHIGRRPVLVGSLALEVVAMVMFLFAPTIEWVTVARIIQGVATGAATSAFSASIVELAPEKHKKLATIIGSVAPAGGLGVGALLTGVAIQFSHSASSIVFITLSAIMVTALLVVALSQETVVPRAGALRSLIPRVSIPAAARREFAAAVPVHIAAWALAGLFLGLVPTILQTLFHLHSGLLNGVTVFVEPGTAAAVGFVLARLTPRHTTLLGGSTVLLGTLVITAGIFLGSLPLLWVGGIIGGVGFGASFSGAVRLIAPLVGADERAGLFAGIYLVAYLAFGVPAIVAGQLVAPLGLPTTVLAYSAFVVVASVVGVIAQLLVSSRVEGPPLRRRTR